MNGYTQSELDDVQAKWNLRFPPDLAALYLEQRSVIPNDTFDWIDTPEDKIRGMIGWPLEGFLFDVQAGLWWPDWGERPSSPSDAEDRFRAIFATAPKLIPIHDHRCIPEEPHEAGNPVFSVWQMDVIHYGANLAHYVTVETRAGTDEWPAMKEIPFWTRAVEFNNERFSDRGGFTFFNKDGALPE